MMSEYGCVNCAFGDMDNGDFPCCDCLNNSEWASKTEGLTISIACVDGSRIKFNNCKNIKRDKKWLSFWIVSENDKQQININVNSLITYIVKYDEDVKNDSAVL